MSLLSRIAEFIAPIGYEDETGFHRGYPPQADHGLIRSDTTAAFTSSLAQPTHHPRTNRPEGRGAGGEVVNHAEPDGSFRERNHG